MTKLTAAFNNAAKEPKGYKLSFLTVAFVEISHVVTSTERV